MTIEQAIEILDLERQYYGDFESIMEACRMGMEALKRQRQRWIPVSEKLPKIWEDVLVYSRSRGVVVDYCDGGLFGSADVTHWLPLPEPPVKGENGNAPD